MPLLITENYTPGILSEQGKLPDGVLVAKDLSNLQSDGDGFLKLRNAVVDTIPNNSIFVNNPNRPLERIPKLEGIARYRELILMNVGGMLFASKRPNDTPVAVDNGVVTDLEGRLSIIDVFDDYVILTSEGSDIGWWLYNVKESIEDITAHPMSFEKPDFTPSFMALNRRRSEGIETGKIFYYKLTYANDIDQEALHPFQGIEGQSGEASKVNALGVEDAGSKRGWFVGGTFPGWDRHEIVTKINVYRSDGYDQSDTEEESFEPENFRLVGSFERGENGVEDFANEATRLEGKALNDSENTAFPQTATSLAYFQGTIFATCGTELRACDFDYGNIYPNRWSIDRSIKRDSVQFQIVHFKSLYFGDRHNIWALDSSQDYNFPFAVSRMNNNGAIDSYAAAQVEGGLGIIGESGFYIGSGVNFTKVSGALDEYFKNTVAIRGSVRQLSNNSILWSVEYLNGKRSAFLMLQDSNLGITWERWGDIAFDQTIERINRDVTVVDDFGDSVIANIEDGGFFDEEEGISLTDVIGSNRRRQAPQQIVWHGEDSGQRLSIDWNWNSHDLFASGASIKKLWRRLVITGEGEINVKFKIDDKTIEKNIEVSGVSKIPIRTTGYSLSINLKGSKKVTIKSFILEYENLRDWRI